MLLSKAFKFGLFFFFVDVFHAQDDDVIPLVKLMELQTKHCTEAKFCTLRILDEISPQLDKQCCQTCSCEEGCKEQGTCCPDYHLIDSIGTNISNSILEFSDRLKNVNFADIQQDRLTCVDQTLPRKFRSLTDKSKVTYKMISSCPAVFSGNQTILEKCEEPKDIDTFEFDLFIPVTSLKSGTTYRNKYCLLCNEESNRKTDAKYWTSTMYCKKGVISQLHLVAPNDYFSGLLTTYTIPESNLVFTPSTDIVSDFDIDRCDVVQIETCPDGSDEQLDAICKSFHLPVTFYVYSWKSVRYQNIACFLCNNINQTFYPVCQIKTSSFYNDRMFGLELSILRDENNAIVHSKEHENDVLNVDVTQEENNVCGAGFIQNNTKSEQTTCVRLHCPWHFYISEGECIPIFTTLQNIMFTATLEVRRTEKFDQAMVDEIRKNYLEEIVRIGTSIFNEFTYGLWEVNRDFDLLAVSFISNYTYNAILRQYESFLDMVCILKINAKSSAVYVSTFHARSLKHSYGSIPYVKHVPKEIYNHEDPQPSMERFEIYTSHLCYRVERPKSERYFYSYNSTVYGFLQKMKSTSILVCVDEVYNNLKGTSSAFMFGGTCAQTTIDFVQNKKKYKTTKQVNNNNKKNNENDNDNVNNDNKLKTLNLDRQSSPDDDSWSDLSKGLLAGGVVFAGVVVYEVVVTFRKRQRQDIEVEEEQDSQQE